MCCALHCPCTECIHCHLLPTPVTVSPAITCPEHEVPDPDDNYTCKCKARFERAGGATSAPCEACSGNTLRATVGNGSCTACPEGQAAIKNQTECSNGEFRPLYSTNFLVLLEVLRSMLFPRMKDFPSTWHVATSRRSVRTAYEYSCRSQAAAATLCALIL